MNTCFRYSYTLTTLFWFHFIFHGISVCTFKYIQCVQYNTSIHLTKHTFDMGRCKSRVTSTLSPENCHFPGPPTVSKGVSGSKGITEKHATVERPTAQWRKGIPQWTETNKQNKTKQHKQRNKWASKWASKQQCQDKWYDIILLIGS